MSTITMSGLGSGINYDTWISALVAVKQADIDKVTAKATKVESKKDTLSTIESDYKDLLSAIQKFTKALSTENVFNQKAASSSSTAVSASVTSKSDVQNVSVEVESLATSTVARSTYAVASYVDSSTKMSDISEGAVKEGNFSIFVNGQKHQISLTNNSTMSDVLTAINGTLDGGGQKVGGISGISATLSNGKLSITADNSSTTLSVGSASDTSNFTKVMSLTSSTNGGITTYSSSKSVFDTNSATAITSNTFSADASGTNTTIRTGTFSINGTSFTIDDTTTLDSLVSTINKSKAGVTAAWDSNSGKLSLTATDQGAVSIDVEAGTSNFTDVMGLTSSTWTSSEVDGKTVYALGSTKLNTDSQTLGTNAVLKINGTEITSASNTVTSDVTGIAGLTLTLNSTTASAAKVSVTQDIAQVTDALNTLVSAYNKSISATNTATATDGQLYGESILKTLRNSIRSIVTSAVTGEDGYKTLASIGISTGKFSTNAKADTSQLKIDTDALSKALKSDSSAVKAVLTGDSTNKGILNKLESLITDATDSSDGYFVKREASYTKEKKQYTDKASKMSDNLEAYKSRLEIKFSAMDKLISNLKNSASTFDSYFNKSSSSS